jgi:hypothetical protein
LRNKKKWSKSDYYKKSENKLKEKYLKLIKEKPESIITGELL